MELSYFPGCSLHGTSVEYDMSTRAVCTALDIELKELEDWNCCGATSGHAIGGDLALALPARNLQIASKAGKDVVVPCAACFNRLRTAQVAASEGKLPEGMDPIKEPIEVRSLPEVLAQPANLSRLAGKVSRALDGMNAVAYYGCLLVRPGHVTGATNIEDPQDMDAVLKVLGVQMRKWSFKTQCCGGGLALGRPDIVNRLALKLVAQARRSKADFIVTACPMCMTNLEIRQWEAIRAGQLKSEESIPVLYVTEIIGLALGMDGIDGWLGKHLLDPRPALKAKGLS